MDSKIQALVKDNKTLEKNLSEMSVNTSQGSSTQQIEQNLKMLNLEKERDQLRWEQQKERLEVENEKIKELLQSKDFEIRNKEEQVMIKLRDDFNLTEQSYNEEI